VNGTDPLSNLRVGVISLGCAKNLVDTEVALGHLVAAGATVTADEREADVLVVNTCGFIEAAREESLGEIEAALELKRGGSCRYVVVAGCLVQRWPELLARDLPGVDAWVGVGDPAEIVRCIRQAAHGEAASGALCDLGYLYDHLTPRLRSTSRWTAWVKIAEGCDHRCAFCVIPQIRGHYRSRTIDSVVAEVRQLVSEGVREVNLIAQDTTRFGHDLPGADGPKLAALLRALATQTEAEWIRLLYCFPDRLSDEVIGVLAEYPRLVPYVDLPLQHASSRVLRAMRRPGDAERYTELLAKVRDRIPGVAIRTAFIVGFPGETDEDFAQLRGFVAAQRFDRLFVFQYSPEEGTAAAGMADAVPAEVAEERFHDLMALQARISLARNEARVGSETTVLCERRVVGPQGSVVAVGRSELDAPEVDHEVHVLGTDAEPGQFVRARIARAFEYQLVATALSDPW